MIGKFTGNSWEILREFPENSQEIPGKFQEIHGKSMEKFVVYSGKIPENSWENPGKN